MKVFVGYGYNERDAWIKNLVFPIIEAFGHEVISGEEMEGENIAEGVISRIKSSDVLIGFLTRRGDKSEQGQYKTHQWVKDEITTAVTNSREIIVVIETDIDEDYKSRITQDRQHIAYDEKHRDQFLVKLVKIISRWPNKDSSLRITLMPKDFCNEIPGINPSYLDYQYQFLIKNQETEWRKGIFRDFNESIAIDISTKGIPINQDQVYIKITARFQDKIWETKFISFNQNAMTVTMKR